MDMWTADIWNSNEEECKRILNEPGNWEKVMKIDFLSNCKICVGLLMKTKYVLIFLCLFVRVSIYIKHRS